MCAEASAILVAVEADFFFDGRHLEVSTDVIVLHIPWCIDDYAQDLGCGCCAPELDAISPDGFDHGFVEKELVGWG
jgi:hypothetical protein